MQTEEIVFAVITSILSLSALIVSIIAIVKSNSSASGMMELEVRNGINEQRRDISEIDLKLSPLLDKRNCGESTSFDDSQIEALHRQFNEATERLLNAYEEGCSKYIDRKIDIIRFKKLYQVEIRNLLESPDLKQFFDPHTSRFKAIIKVYTEWENQEK